MPSFRRTSITRKCNAEQKEKKPALTLRRPRLSIVSLLPRLSFSMLPGMFAVVARRNLYLYLSKWQYGLVYEHVKEMSTCSSSNRIRQEPS